MRNTIIASYGTKSYQNFFNEYEKELKIEEISPKEMTFEEYKKYIYQKISELPIHPSNRNDFIAVPISDAGFRAMKADPEYEKWVLDTLQRDFMCYDPWGSSGKYVIHSFGASKEAYRGESWRMEEPDGKDRYNQKSKNSFWERKARRRKQLKEQYEKLLRKRLLEKKFYEKKIYERKLQQRKYETDVIENKITANQQSKEWYQKKQWKATTLYEESSIIEMPDTMNLMG